jgi:hypothetical protein
MTIQEQSTPSKKAPKHDNKQAAAKASHPGNRQHKGPTAMAEALTKASQDAGKAIVPREPKPAQKTGQKPHNGKPNKPGKDSPVAKRVPRKQSLRVTIKKNLEELFAKAARANLKITLESVNGNYEVLDVQPRRDHAPAKKEAK